MIIMYQMVIKSDGNKFNNNLEFYTEELQFHEKFKKMAKNFKIRNSFG